MSRVTKPVNLTLSDGVKSKAKELKERGSYKSLTALIEELIRKRHDEVFGPHGVAPSEEALNKAVEKAIAELNESGVPYRADNPPSKTADTTKPAAEKKRRVKKPR